ncbi:MAG: Trk family potassium uptake protein [Selenomonadaceae bacterium]|nr:Trk family potassium uptake protein [Selenomonadaceae bacterium]
MKNLWLRLRASAQLKPTQMILLSFLLLIAVGTFLLCLPISTTDGEGLRWVDSLLVATSASCVTGLTVVDVHNDLTMFGTVTLISLIQIGGLGIITLAVLVYHTIGRRLQLRDQMLLQESMNQKRTKGLVDMTLRVVKYTVCIEAFFAVLLTFHFFPEFGWDALGYGVFHSISGFCNAGFDLFGNYDSVVKRNTDSFLLIVFALLVMLGGIGFPVMSEVVHVRSWKRFSLHTKLVLSMNTLLLLLGTVVVFALEHGNPTTLGTLATEDQWVNSFFMSVSPRTAGFNSFDLQAALQETREFFLLLMFIGASPVSTGGGIKTTTFAVILCSIWAVLRDREDAAIFGRRLSIEMRNRAFAIFTVSSMWVLLAVFLIAISDHEVHEIQNIVFEVMSAFGTVGLGLGITNQWSDFGKCVLSLTMFIGRVGLLTLLLSMTKQRKTKIRYPSENVMIG